MEHNSVEHREGIHTESRPKQTRSLEGWFSLIWKYKLHYLIVLPALLLILIFKLIPFFKAIYIPFIEYEIFRGIANSPWVGLDNFRQLFKAPEFRHILANTLIIKITYIIACGFTALLISLAISGIQSRKLRSALSTLILIPYFVPAVIFAYAVMFLLSPSQSPLFTFNTFILSEPSLFRPLLVAVEVIKTSGIPVLIALAAIGARHAALTRDGNYLMESNANFSGMNLIPALRAISAFMLLQFSTILSTDLELISTLVNPLVFQTGDTLNTYMFRIGFMNAQFSVAGALWLLQFIVQLLFTLLAYLLVRGFFFHDLFSTSKDVSDIHVRNKSGSFIGTLITMVYLLVALLPLYVLFIHPFITSSTSEVNLWELVSVKSFVLYVWIALAAIIIHLGITLTLAFPLTVKNLPGRSIYKAFLLFILVMSAGSIHEYIFVKDMGMVNTYFPQLFFGFFSIINIFVLKSIFNSKYADLKEQASQNGRGELHAFFTLFIPKIWKPLIALGVLQWVFIWNSYYTSMIYTSNPDQFSPILFFRTLSTSADSMGIPPGDPVIMQLGALISLPSILLLLIFRKWITSEVLIGQIRKL